MKRRKALFWESGAPDYVVPYTEDSTAAMVRLRGVTPAQAEAAFGAVEVLSHEGNVLAVLTPVMKEQTLVEATDSLGDRVISCIRVAE